MKNEYLTIEDYKKYISLFHLNEEEKKIVESLILKVKWIIKLKDETPQKSTRLYLKPIMFQKDYKNIDKVLNDQLSLKVDRNCERYKRQLEENKIYSKDEIQKMTLKYKEDLMKDFGLRKKSKIKRNKENRNILKLEDVDNLEYIEEE